jgi:hypothetical protein
VVVLDPKRLDLKGGLEGDLGLELWKDERSELGDAFAREDRHFAMESHGRSSGARGLGLLAARLEALQAEVEVAGPAAEGRVAPSLIR